MALLTVLILKTVVAIVAVVEVRALVAVGQGWYLAVEGSGILLPMVALLVVQQCWHKRYLWHK